MQFAWNKKKSELAKKQSAEKTTEAKTTTSNNKQSHKPVKDNAPQVPVYNDFKKSSPSLKNVLQKNIANEPDADSKKENKSKKIDKNQPKDIFSNDELKTAWLKFAEEIKDDMPRMYQVLHNHIPQKENDCDVNIDLDSENQKKEFQEKIKNKLTEYLFKELNNYYIDITINVSGTAKKDFIYTTTDKYTYLTKKNDAVRILKEKFNLDFE